MPFPTIGTLPPDPTVRVFFSGLMIIKGANGKAEVFVNRAASDHHFSVETRLKRTGKPDVILMRHLGPLAFAIPEPASAAQTIHGLIIKGSSPQGVRRYDGTTSSTEGERLLPHAFNLGEHHPGQTRVDLGGARPSIFFDDGIFYSAELTSADTIVQLLRGETVVKVLDPIAAIIGVNLYNSEVNLVWRQNGSIVTLPLKPPTAGTSQEIYITNDPLYEDPVLSPNAHDELNEYYRILPDVNSSAHFTMRFVETSSQPLGIATKRDDRGTPRIPCMPAVDEP